MAIYHMSGTVISRGKGQSAIASASYRSGDKLYSERYDKYNMYHRIVQPESFILKPEHAPEWTLDREKLWNEVEKIEVAKNSRLAREFNVALPKELSNEKQYELTREYVQKSFVDRGMVADVSIHRDDVNNPHFHAMLTVRPFDENGNWSAKSKKEFLKDENGDFILNDKGNKKTRKVDLVDWNSKESMLTWRKEWADITNIYLKENGINQSISHESYEKRGIEQIPTIHEGYVARKMESNGQKSDRCEINRNIKNANKLIKDKVLIEEDIKQIKQANNIVRLYNDEEKEQLKDLTKDLKIFISHDTLMDKERSLNNWLLSTLVSFETKENINSKLSVIDNQFEKVMQAEKLLENESRKLIEKYYPYVKLDNLSTYQVNDLSNRTLINDKVFEKEDVKKILVNSKIHEVDIVVAKLIYNPINNVEHLQNLKNKANENIETIKDKYGITNFTKENVNELDESDKNKVKFILKDIKRYNLALNKVDEYYNQRLKGYLSDNQLDKLDIKQKEFINLGITYCKDTTVKDLLNNKIQKQFDDKDMKLGIRYVSIYKNNREKAQDYLNKIDNPKLKTLLSDPKMHNLFINDCIRNVKMTEEEKDLIKKSIKKNNDIYDELTTKDDYEVYKAQSNTSLVNSLFRTTDLDRLENENKYKDRQKAQAHKEIMNKAKYNRGR